MPTISAQEFIAKIIRGEQVSHDEVHGPVNAAHVLLPHPLRVAGVRFIDAVYMPDARCAASVHFNDCRFEGGANFRSATFRGDASFSGSHFSRAAYFWRASFRSDAGFRNIVVERGPSRAGSVDAGEFNLSWATFAQQADFYRARLHGPFRLWRTIFLGAVNLEQSYFGDIALFMGRAQDVSIDLFDFAKGGDACKLFDLLHAHGLVDADDEVREPHGDRDFPRFVHPRARSQSELLQQLTKTTVAVEVRDRMVDSFAKQARTMFAPEARAVLRAIEISSAGQLHLLDMDMQACLLLGTRLSNAIFSNVTWTEKRLVPYMTRRLTTADEGASPLEHIRLHRLYADIAGTYERQKEESAASRFRITAREMSRRSHRGATRLISSLYRTFAAYGENAGLALCWLAFFVLVLFPLAYLAVARSAGLDVARALMTSLEVATFLGPTKDDSTWRLWTPIRMLMGIERVVVSAQVAFLLLALRRLFPA